ncbi:MAG: hypothetical protein DBX59_00870 [Bacillota bacterium]|nr:MAG: hypothetical protein DBX59_00870 [Bacillota bacterium]
MLKQKSLYFLHPTKGQGPPETFYQIGEAKPPPSLLLAPVRGGGQKGSRVGDPGRASTASKPVGLFRFLFGHKKERLRGRNAPVEVLPLSAAPGLRLPGGPFQNHPLSGKAPNLPLGGHQCLHSRLPAK